MTAMNFSEAYFALVENGKPVSIPAEAQDLTNLFELTEKYGGGLWVECCFIIALIFGIASKRFSYFGEGWYAVN